jgi:hypothetical protein
LVIPDLVRLNSLSYDCYLCDLLALSLNQRIYHSCCIVKSFLACIFPFIGHIGFVINLGKIRFYVIRFGSYNNLRL